MTSSVVASINGPDFRLVTRAAGVIRVPLALYGQSFVMTWSATRLQIREVIVTAKVGRDDMVNRIGLGHVHRPGGSLCRSFWA